MSAKNPMHPGKFIMGAYIEPLEITASEAAESLGIHRATFSRLLNQKIDVSPEMAMRLSDVFGGSPESWINMQTSHTLARLRSSDGWRKGKRTKPIKALKHKLRSAAA
jgi:addiction module HigA family antidote